MKNFKYLLFDVAHPRILALTGTSPCRTASTVLETSLGNNSAEVLWLRIGQPDSVLEGVSRVEAETLAWAYFQYS
jgi:hypothetical protein